MTVVIDYKAGNLYNVGNALKYLGVDFVFSGDPEVVATASRVILPGVGSARAAMDSLSEQGLVPVLRNLRVPFLGICLGLQVLYDMSEEENTSCLELLPGTVRCCDRSSVKVPHIGWNQVRRESNLAIDSGAGKLLEGIPDDSYFYFVHSYFAAAVDSTTLAVTDYDETFASIVARDRFWGVQFHPERSGEVGLRLLKNFIEAS